jgi:hypothetical protein
MMEYRDIEYAVVQGIGRGVWKWSASVAGVVIMGNEQTRSAAVAAAEKSIDRALAQRKVRLVPPPQPDRHEAPGMSDGDKQLASDALRILHGGRSFPPAEAVEALSSFLESMRRKGSGDTLAHASIAAVTELVRSLEENHAASDDLWQEAIEATLSFANEAG